MGRQQRGEDHSYRRRKKLGHAIHRAPKYFYLSEVPRLFRPEGWVGRLDNLGAPAAQNPGRRQLGGGAGRDLAGSARPGLWTFRRVEERHLCIRHAKSRRRRGCHENERWWANLSTLPIPDVNLLIDTYFTDETNGWVVGGRGGDAYEKLTPVVLRTTDGGAHWEDRLQGSGIQFPLGEWGWKIEFLNDQLGFVSLENFDAAAILKTTDGGRTWKRIEVRDQQGNMDLEGIGFLTKDLGWVGGWGKKQVGTTTGWSSGTTDGGATWVDANEVGRFINRFRFTGTEPIVGYASGATIYQCVATDSDGQHEALAASASAFAKTLEDEMPLVTDKLQITADIPMGAKQLNISVWSQRQLLIKRLVDEKNPTPGPRSVTWDFTKPDGTDAGNGYFLYRVSIDDNVESKMVHRPWLAAADDLGTRVAQMIKNNPTARRAHDLLILPDANGNPVPLKALFDTPRDLMAGLIRGGWVIPRFPRRSIFLLAVIGTDSRPGPMHGRLSPEEVQLLNDWIAAGAVIPDSDP